jgi:hypothetical protein
LRSFGSRHTRDHYRDRGRHTEEGLYRVSADGDAGILVSSGRAAW